MSEQKDIKEIVQKIEDRERRDRFALAALTGAMSDTQSFAPTRNGIDASDLASVIVSVADQVIKKLDKNCEVEK